MINHRKETRNFENHAAKLEQLLAIFECTTTG